jgi:hypothetical protein
MDQQNDVRDFLTSRRGKISRTPQVSFRKLWAAHNVRFHRSGTKSLNHPVVGRLDLSFEALELPVDQGLTLLTYNAEPGTASADGLTLLATWAATIDQDTHPLSVELASGE